MKITQILINHMTTPIGFKLNDLRIEFKVQADYFTEATKQPLIWTTEKSQPIYQKRSRIC